MGGLQGHCQILSTPAIKVGLRGVDVIDVVPSSLGLGLAGADTRWAGMLALRA
jgi:hypothetical protein